MLGEVGLRAGVGGRQAGLRVAGEDGAAVAAGAGVDEQDDVVDVQHGLLAVRVGGLPCAGADFLNDLDLCEVVSGADGPERGVPFGARAGAVAGWCGGGGGVGVAQPDFAVGLGPPGAFEAAQFLGDFAALVAVDLRGGERGLVPGHAAADVAADQGRVDPSVRDKDGADGEFGSGMEIRLGDGADDSGERPRGGLELGDGERVDVGFIGHDVYRVAER